MEVFLTYVLILFASSIVGESLITFTQDVFLYGIYPINWITGLPKSLGAVLLLSSIIALVAFIKMRPIINVQRKIKKNEPLTDEEKLVFAKTLPKISKVTCVGLVSMYIIGNVASAYIRTLNGVINVSQFTNGELPILITSIVLQTIFYAICAILYCCEVFTLVIQKYVRKIGLEIIPDTIDEHPFTKLLGVGALSAQLFATGNLLLLVVGTLVLGRNIPPKTAFTYTMILLVVDAMCFYPMAKYMFASLRLRLNVSNKNIKKLIAEGDLTKRQTVETTDGFGMLNSNINSLIVHLQTILKNIQNAVSIVDENANILSNNVDSSIEEMRLTNKLLDEVESSNKVIESDIQT